MTKNRKISFLFLTAYLAMLLNLVMHDSLCFSYDESVFEEYAESSHCHTDHNHHHSDNKKSNASHSAYCCGHFDFLISVSHDNNFNSSSEFIVLFIQSTDNIYPADPFLPENNIYFQNVFKDKPLKITLCSSPLRAPPVV